jgi:(S)-sulfolactate dehydrogenase
MEELLYSGASRSVKVFPATGANDASVAEYVIATALQLLRGAYDASSQVMAGGWPRQALIGREIQGKTLGLLGYGAIARETAQRGAALGMEIIAYDPYAENFLGAAPVSFSDLLRQSDVLSLHVPLTDDTRGLMDGAAFDQMKKGAVLINAARGGVVVEPDLAHALKTGTLWAAALDVFEEEPLGAEKGTLFEGLNVILTPHIAGVTEESNERVSDLTAKNVLKALGHLS